MSDDRYDNNDEYDDETHPLAANDPQTRPQQHRPSAAQRREHPGATQNGRPAQGGYPPPDRAAGGGAFVTALLATLIAIAASLAASYLNVRHRLGSRQLQQHLQDTGLVVWPKGRSNGVAGSVLRLETWSFALIFAVAAIFLLVLLWAAVGSVPGGRGAFAVFLAGWGATLIAGVLAIGVGYYLAADGLQGGQGLFQIFFQGSRWAINVGWLAGLVAAIGQSLRPKVA